MHGQLWGPHGRGQPHVPHGEGRGLGQQGHHDTGCVNSHFHRTTRVMRVCPTSLELDLVRDTVPPTRPQASPVDATGGHLQTQPTSRGRTRAVTVARDFRPSPARSAHDSGDGTKPAEAGAVAQQAARTGAPHRASAVISRWGRPLLRPGRDNESSHCRMTDVQRSLRITERRPKERHLSAEFFQRHIKTFNTKFAQSIKEV